MFENWLQPQKLSDLELPELQEYQVGKHIQQFKGNNRQLGRSQIALIGANSTGTEAIRQAFYQMSFPFDKLKVVDLGNTRKSTPSFITPLLRELREHDIFPILIGDHPQLNLAQFNALKTTRTAISINIVDERIPYTAEAEEEGTYYLHRLFARKRPQLFHFSVIGCQSHFLRPTTVNFMDERHYEYFGVGKAKADLSELEPIIRDADLMGFNLSALKGAEAPGQAKPTPSGFTVEEACQICRYAGLSDKLGAFGIYGYWPEKDINQLSAQAVAQMLWYFFEGFYHRQNDYPLSNDGLVEYIVDVKNLAFQLVFWKSKKTGRWWIQVPVKTSKRLQRHRLIPCSYNDYRKACQDELPDRLFNAFRRFA